ncbi:MAG: hypothetical protein H6739_24695 [Alphaproteobacteria bacterium]|nr:hypothetical protein [Alphaproteobacteria bacterium]
MRPDTRRPWLETLAVLAALPLVALWPLPRALNQGLLAAPGQEAADHLFGLHAALEAADPVIVDTLLAGWPVGTRFVLVDPLHLVPFGLGSLIGPIAGYNLVLWFGVLVAGLAGALLSRELGGRMWVGAALAVTSPPLLSSVSEGQTENFAVGWVALQLFLLLRYLRSGRPGWGAAAAVALAACFYGGPYNGVFAALIDGAVGLWWVRRRPGVLGVGALAAALVAPLAYGVLYLRGDHLPGALARAALPEATGLLHGFRGGLRYGIDLTDAWAPAPLTGGTADIAHTGYIGIIALVLAGIAVARDRRLWPWLAGGLAFLLVALGPHLYWKGEVLRWGGQPLLAPVGVLIEALPEVGRMNRWYRAAAVASLLLIPLAARACRPSWLVAFAVADALWLSPVPWPHGVQQPRFAADLLTLEAPGPLLEVPHHQDHAVRDNPGDENLYAAALHGRPLSGSFLGIPGWLAPHPLYRQLQEVGQRGGDAGPVVAAFAEQGFAYLVWYPEYARLSPQGRRALDAALGPPVVRKPELVVWRLGTSDAPAP